MEEKILFNGNKENLTIGVELEFQVLDKNTLNLTPRASELLFTKSLSGLSKELFQSTIELVTPVCKTVQDVEKYYKHSLPLLREEGGRLGLTFAGTGTHPMADYRDRLITPSVRYQTLVSKNQWLIRRMAVYGVHFHIGMTSGEECIEYHRFFLQIIPHLLALSASSPFWQGTNTELASCRPTMYESLPTAGIPYQIENWNDFQLLVNKLIQTKSITDYKDLWWDVRPSPSHGTVEVRICDGASSLAEMLAIASFLHAIAHWYRDNRKAWLKNNVLEYWAIRENKWRAIRYGLDASIIQARDGTLCSIRDDIKRWLQQLAPYYDMLQYESYKKELFSILSSGNSSERQQRIFKLTRSLKEVVRLNVQEFYNEKPIVVF